MTALADIVSINRRFARSARVDTDLNGTPPLVGYVLQASVAKALSTLAESQIESQQSAFTWTGPYGGGKSSAALLVANLVAGASENRRIARKIVGKPLQQLYAKAFPDRGGPWHVVAVTGGRMSLREAIAEAAAASFEWPEDMRSAAQASDGALIDMLSATATADSGVLVILDELGKMLEHEAASGGDVHLLQDLAERASRSAGRLVVIGILHQSFDQYAARAARDARQEWAKVQGRYQDIAFLSGADETVALLGQAIACDLPPPKATEQAYQAAAAVAKRRPADVALLTDALAQTWPLNPITALLLGPVSRQRFAQNERSLFGFLSSAEPDGFQDFLANTPNDGTTYGPAQLWDYLVGNVGMALAGGSDGTRFSLAFEAIERAAVKGGVAHVAVTKAAAVIEFFRNGSGVVIADDFLGLAVPGIGANELSKVVTDLLEWAVLIRQPRLGGYALFAGSDFDLEDAITRSVAPIAAEQLALLPQRAGFGFATAKRHYFETGALRTFEILIKMVGADDNAADLAPVLAGRNARGSGAMVMLMGDGSIDGGEVEALAKATAKKLKGTNVVMAIGSLTDSYALRDSATELFAVERVLRDHPQLEGDRIARREIAARQSSCIDSLHRTLETALATARWWFSPQPGKAHRAPLTAVATMLADAGFPETPVLKSELLQRDRPSSSAMAALRELCHAMVANAHKADLGIEGFPAEMGLYLTLLKEVGLHRADDDGNFDFRAPPITRPGAALRPAWTVLENRADTPLNEIYATWAQPPYGMKAGVMPVVTLAYLLANRERVAVYVDGVFQTDLDDVVVDKLLQKPAEIRLRRIDRSVRETAFLSQLATLFGLDQDGKSLPVARALFQAFEELPQYALRTNSISEDARIVRATVLKASDPESLLFEGLPEALGERLTPELIMAALEECRGAYPALLQQMRDAMARSLGVDRSSFGGLAKRADVISNLTNDYNFDAFARRAALFESGEGDIEGLISLLLHKPAHGWSDRDRDQALVEMAAYGRRFRELEALAVVRDRRSSTEALALVVGIDPNIPPLMRSFILTDDEKRQATSLADEVLATLNLDAGNGHLRLAALARAVASLAAEQEAV